MALTHTNLLALTLCVLAISFTSVMWNAWGKRGGLQTFAMVLPLVFQMAAHASHPMDASATWQHLAWITVGALGLAQTRCPANLGGSARPAHGPDRPAAHAAPGPWLLHRLEQTVDEARALTQAAKTIDQCTSDIPR